MDELKDSLQAAIDYLNIANYVLGKHGLKLGIKTGELPPVNSTPEKEGLFH